MENILKIFTSEDEKEVKQAFKDLLINQFNSDLKENPYYLFSPKIIEELIHNLYEECIYEIQDDLKKMIKKQFKENLTKASNEGIVKVLGIVE